MTLAWSHRLSLSLSRIFIIILVITFIHGIYKFIPETNHVSRVYGVTTVLYLKHVLCFYISTFGSMCAVPNMAVCL